MNKPLACLSAAAALCLAAPAHAQFAKPEDAVKYRQSAFVLMGNQMGRINAQLKSPAPNMAAVQSSAALIETLSKLPYEAFTPDSELVPGSKAKPEAWKDASRFKQLAEKMQAEVVKLNAVARTGDVKAVQAQFGAVGQSCKNCHDDFRMK